MYTFGYGAEHDSELLNAIASAGNGIFYYIDNPDNIPESFCDCLGGLLSVTAQVREGGDGEGWGCTGLGGKVQVMEGEG